MLEAEWDKQQQRQRGAPRTSDSLRQEPQNLEGVESVPLGYGEILDRASILEVKAARIAPEKQRNVRNELALYIPMREQLLGTYPALRSLYTRMCELHALLWDIEDGKRVLEKGRPPAEFVANILGGDASILKRYVEISREVSLYNDERASVKKQMNVITGSGIVEEKSHGTVS